MISIHKLKCDQQVLHKVNASLGYWWTVVWSNHKNYLIILEYMHPGPTTHFISMSVPVWVLFIMKVMHSIHMNMDTLAQHWYIHKKYRENCKTLPWEHHIGGQICRIDLLCRGFIMVLTAVTTASAVTTIFFLNFFFVSFSQLEILVLSQF